MFKLLAPVCAKLLIMLSCLLLTACGGGDSGGNSTNTSPPGTLKTVTRLSSYTASQINQAITAPATHITSVVPLYDITAYRLEYQTRDGKGNSVRASALLALPDKPASFKSPLLAYQHGTLYHNDEAPSNHAVASEPAVILASLGYIVMAADYVGYGVSQGTPHPYLLAQPSANAVVDLITASKTWLANQQIAHNGQLFLTGYSEGGYVTMATHMAMQAQGLTVTSSVPGAGPYNIQLALDELLQGIAQENPLLSIVTSPSFLQQLSKPLRIKLRNLMLDKILPDDADIVFQTDFLDNYLAGATATIAAKHNVDHWKPVKPVRMFHGQDDETVPYQVAVSTLQTMQALGATDVTLTDCVAASTSHSGCTRPYASFMTTYFSGIAEGL